MKFEKKYISEAICIIEYKTIDDKVRYRAADAEAAFAIMFPKQSQQSNVPDNADPNLPRLIFQNGQKQLSVSQKMCQLNLSFGNNEKDIHGQLKIIEKNLLEFQGGLYKFKNKQELGLCAIVFSVNVPSKDGRDAMLHHAYSRFFKVDQQAEFGDLASYSFNVGYKTKELHYLNYEADIYELRKMDLPKPTLTGQVLRFDLGNMPLVEEGIGVRVDINNRPKVNSTNYVYSGVEELIPVATVFILGKLNNIMGFD